jgi:hypothetical protein
MSKSSNDQADTGDGIDPSSPLLDDSDTYGNGNANLVAGDS